MQEPSGELVELDFYFGTMPCSDALRDVTEFCCHHGGEFAGEVLASQFNNARTTPFEGIYSSAVETISVEHAELPPRLNDADTRIVKVPIWSAMGLTKEVPEIVTFSGISKEASAHDCHPVAIVSEGWVFSTPGYEKEALKAGRRCYRRFVEICGALAPDYAAILNEDSLPCRHDLRNGHGDESFCDFFVNSRNYGNQVITEVERMYNDAYTERIDSGIWVSTSPVFNPRRRGVDRKTALARSQVVAGMLVADRVANS